MNELVNGPYARAADLAIPYQAPVTGDWHDNCPVRWRDRHAVVTLPDRIDVSNASQIRQELRAVFNRGATELIADMTATVSCDHAGADVMARAYQRALVTGTQLRLVVTAPAVRRMLALNGLDCLIPIYPSLEAAAAVSATVVSVTAGPGAPHVAQRAKPDPAAPRRTSVMTIFGRPGIDWTVVLRRRPACIVDGHVEGGYTDTFEIICCDCGDDPSLDYREASPGLQRIRGPYRLAAGIAAYQQHLVRHPNRPVIHRSDQSGRDRMVSDRLAPSPCGFTQLGDARQAAVRKGEQEKGSQRPGHPEVPGAGLT